MLICLLVALSCSALLPLFIKIEWLHGPFWSKTRANHCTLIFLTSFVFFINLDLKPLFECSSWHVQISRVNFVGSRDPYELGSLQWSKAKVMTGNPALVGHAPPPGTLENKSPHLLTL